MTDIEFMNLEDLVGQTYDETRLIGTIIKIVQDNDDTYKDICFGLKFELTPENLVRIVLVKRFEKILDYFDYFKSEDIARMTAIVFFFKTNYQLVWSGPEFFTTALFKRDYVGHYFSEAYTEAESETEDNGETSEKDLLQQGFADLSKIFATTKRSGAA